MACSSPSVIGSWHTPEKHTSCKFAVPACGKVRGIVWILAVVVAVGCGTCVLSQTTQGAKDYLSASPADLQWFRDAKFGMFVCWGPVTLTGKEIGWSRGEPPWGRRPGMRGGKGPTPVDVYDSLYKKWKPEHFDARQWVRVAKDAGARYMIFLVKHHDGFCLYDTNLTDHKIAGPESAWQVDVMKQIADACHESGLKLIVYYSQPDWHHPDYLTDQHERYITYLHGQIRELLTHYGRIDGLWFDGLRPRGEKRHGDKYGGAEMWQAEKLFKMARSLQPHLIINNRCGLPGDFDTPEQRVGRYQPGRAWESCITLGTQWAWKPDDRLKSLKECVDLLVRCAGGGGNLALNTNPMPDGLIEPRQAERFREIGRWLDKTGESIYATHAGPFEPGPWGASTQRQETVYVHILQWENESIILPAIKQKITGSSLLTGGTVQVTQSEKGIEISVPASDRNELDTIVVLQLGEPGG